jgi:hypothetical protein
MTLRCHRTSCSTATHAQQRQQRGLARRRSGAATPCRPRTVRATGRGRGRRPARRTSEHIVRCHCALCDCVGILECLSFFISPLQHVWPPLPRLPFRPFDFAQSARLASTDRRSCSCAGCESQLPSSCSHRFYPRD